MATENKLRLYCQPLRFSHITKVSEKEWEPIIHLELLEDKNPAWPISCFSEFDPWLFCVL